MVPLLAAALLMATLADGDVATKPTIFRLGSGAWFRPPRPKATKSNDTQLSRPPLGHHHVQRVLKYCMPMAVVFVLTLMMTAGTLSLIGGGSRDFNHRIPPSWSPENEHNYSFRAYMTNISQWVMLTDLQPHQQCAALIMRLGGSAREMARMITPQEMYNGGSFEPGGEIVDPVT